MNSCEEIVEKYLLNNNPIYTFSFPISLLCGIIIFGIIQAYDVSKNSYVNQLLIPIATIFIIMVLIDIISKNMIPYDIKKNLYNKCESWKNNQVQRNIEKFGTKEKPSSKETLPPVVTPSEQDSSIVNPSLGRALSVANISNSPPLDISDLNKIQTNSLETFENSIEQPLNSKTSFMPELINKDSKDTVSKCIQPTSNCAFCSGGEPKPKGIVTAIPGPQWLPQTAESVQNNLKNNIFTQAKC
jgi:hypothetical protein